VLTAVAILLLASVPDDAAALISKAVAQLVALQEENGAWSYEGVYRVDGEIPVGYRVGGTSIAAEAQLLAARTTAPRGRRSNAD